MRNAVAEWLAGVEHLREEARDGMIGHAGRALGGLRDTPVDLAVDLAVDAVRDEVRRRAPTFHCSRMIGF